MRTADYAAAGFFTEQPLLPGFQLRDITLDMDLHTDKLMTAYKYRS